MSSTPTSPTIQYASFGTRFLAMLIDGVIISIITNLLGFGYSMSAIGYAANSPRLALMLIYTLGFWIWQSATPGKLLLGLKIVEINGQNLTWQKAILRYVGYYISALAIGLGFLWILFDEKKQGWHDKIAGTYVIKG